MLKGTTRLNRLHGGRPAAILVRFFATEKISFPAPYVEFKASMTENKKKYPGLFPTEKVEFANQQKCVEATWEPKTMEANVNAHNAAWQNLWDNWGFDEKKKGPGLLKDVFKTLDFEYMQECKQAPDAFFHEDWEMMDRKMGKVNELLAPVNEIMTKLADTSKMTKAEVNLLNINLDKAKAQLKEWFKRLLLSDDDDLTMSGLPFDSRMMEAVHAEMRTDQLKDFYKDPAMDGKVRAKITEKLVAETWEKMFEVVQVTQPHRTKKEYDDLIKVYHDVLDPHDHLMGLIHDVSKTLFLQAYWAGGEKSVLDVEDAMQALQEYYNTCPADYTEQWKTALQVEPTLALSGEIALFIKATESQFVLKLLNKLRREYSAMLFTRCAHQVLSSVHDHDFDLQMSWAKMKMSKLPDLEEEKRGLRAIMADFADDVDKIIFQQNVVGKEIEIMKAIHEERKDMPVPTIEELTKDMCYEAFWLQENDPRTKDVDAFITDLQKFMTSGKGDIITLENKAKALFPTSLVGKDKPVDDLEYRRTFVTFHRGVRQRMETWGFKDVMLAPTDNKLEKIHHKREVAATHIKRDLPDPVVRMVKHLIETSQAQFLERIIANYSTLVSRFKGEVYGTVSSAVDMSDADFKALVDVLQKQNPGKKYFLDRSTDPNLLAGFVIKCGGQKIDYSLASQVNNLKKAVQV